MEPLGPFATDRRVAVAVSGGADSMALAFLLSAWGRPHAILVDHGLRPGSDDEVRVAAGRLAEFAVPATLLRLCPLAPGADAARTARYGALTSACAAAGLIDLCLGHHAQDQAETVLIRAARGSGPVGLAGMSAITVRGGARLLRPLLGVAPGRLRATLVEAGVAWCDDPGNDDPATVRGALRQAFRADSDLVSRALSQQTAAAQGRVMAEQAVIDELAAAVQLAPDGVATVNRPLSHAALSTLIWTLSGAAYPPAPAQITRAVPWRAQTLHGVQIKRAGALWRLSREPAVLEHRFRGGLFDPARPLTTRFITAGQGGDAERVSTPHV